MFSVKTILSDFLYLHNQAIDGMGQALDTTEAPQNERKIDRMHKYVDPLLVLVEVDILFFLGFVVIGQGSLAKEMRRVIFGVLFDRFQVNELAEINDQMVCFRKPRIVMQFRNLSEHQRLEFFLRDRMDFIQKIKATGTWSFIKIHLVAFEILFHQHKRYGIARLISHSLDLDAPDVAKTHRRQTNWTRLFEVQKVLDNASEAEDMMTFKDFGDDDVGGFGQANRTRNCFRSFELELANVRPVAFQRHLLIL